MLQTGLALENEQDAEIQDPDDMVARFFLETTGSYGQPIDVCSRESPRIAQSTELRVRTQLRTLLGVDNQSVENHFINQFRKVMKYRYLLTQNPDPSDDDLWGFLDIRSPIEREEFLHGFNRWKRELEIWEHKRIKFSDGYLESDYEIAETVWKRLGSNDEERMQECTKRGFDSYVLTDRPDHHQVLRGILSKGVHHLFCANEILILQIALQSAAHEPEARRKEQEKYLNAAEEYKKQSIFTFGLQSNQFEEYFNRLRSGDCGDLVQCNAFIDFHNQFIRKIMNNIGGEFYVKSQIKYLPFRTLNRVE